MNWTVRPFTAPDLDFAFAQVAREGWTASRAWLSAILAHDPGLCFVAESAGRTIAMVTGTAFAETGWIGNLIVDPEHRRRGLGELLMRRVIAAADEAGIRTLRLDADPPGVNIYRRLGFVDEQSSRRFRLDDASRIPPGEPLPPLQSLDAFATLDRGAFGDDRTRLLSLVLPHAAAAVQANDGEKPLGYAMAVPASGAVMLGPCVATDAVTAGRLLCGCLAVCPGAQVTAGCLEDAVEAARLFSALGFRETAPSLRMVRGPAAGVGRPAEVFAIAHGAVG